MSTVRSALPTLARSVDAAMGTLRALGPLTRSGVLRPMRPDRGLGAALALARYRFSLAAAYGVWAARHPERPAIVDDAGSVTYAEVVARTDAMGRGLAARDVGTGTRVGLLCRNHRGAIEGAVAAGKVGADVVLLNTGLSARQLADVCSELRVHTVIADDEFAGALPDGLQVIGADGTGPASLAGLDADVPLPRVVTTGSTIVLTSGTTGTPKGAKRPHLASLSPATAVLSVIPLRAGTPVFIAAPLFHTWGNAALLLSALHGDTIVLRRRYEPASFLDIVAEQRCDTVFAVPVMLQRVLESGESWRGGHRPRIVAVSGSALPGGLATRFMDRFGDCLYNLYGSTEVSWVTIASPADLRDAPGTAGRAPAGTVLRILDEQGRAVPPGVDGRVFVGNDLPFEGYTRAGAVVERHDGLLGTGDMGHLDDRGRLHLTGRADDMIVSGGENVHPGPVEDLITASDQVREAAVIGVRDEEFGQRLAAYVVREPGATIDEAGVRALVREKLGRFAVPRDVVFVDALPRNQTGKVVGRELPEPR